MSSTIAVLPVGPAPADLAAWLAEELTSRLATRAVAEVGISLPDEAYDPDRRQYRSDAVLARLRHVPAAGAARLLGLVEAHCYAPGLNFVFGAAEGGGREAFVALPRLRPSFYGLPDDRELFRARVLKEAVHELGHTWRLEHCPRPSCVMHFSNMLQDTDAKGPGFCRACEARLRRALG
jgi:archaemetzincin